MPSSKLRLFSLLHNVVERGPLSDQAQQSMGLCRRYGQRMAEAAVYRDPEFQPKEGVTGNGESEEQPASPLRLTPLLHRDGQRMFFLRPLHLEPHTPAGVQPGSTLLRLRGAGVATLPALAKNPNCGRNYGRSCSPQHWRTCATLRYAHAPRSTAPHNTTENRLHLRRVLFLTCAVLEAIIGPLAPNPGLQWQSKRSPAGGRATGQKIKRTIHAACILI